MTKSIFISHASKDAEVAQTICAMLEDRGIACWIAPRDIRPGNDYAEEIISGIESTIATVLILSENANESVFVKKEIERAISKSKAVFPVRIREVLPSAGLELFISSSHWVDAWQSPIDGKIDQLANSIRSLEGKPQQAINTPRAVTPGSKRNRNLIIAIGLMATALVAVVSALLVGVLIKSNNSFEQADVISTERMAEINAELLKKSEEELLPQTCEIYMSLRDKSKKCTKKDVDRAETLSRQLHALVTGGSGTEMFRLNDLRMSGVFLIKQGKLDEAEKIKVQMEKRIQKIQK